MKIPTIEQLDPETTTMKSELEAVRATLDYYAKNSRSWISGDTGDKAREAMKRLDALIEGAGMVLPVLPEGYRVVLKQSAQFKGVWICQLWSAYTIAFQGEGPTPYEAAMNAIEKIGETK